MSKLITKPSYEELETALIKITAIAHFGGLSDMTSFDALSAIRHTTLKNHFDDIGKKRTAEVRAIIKGGAA